MFKFWNRKKTAGAAPATPASAPVGGQTLAVEGGGAVALMEPVEPPLPELVVVKRDFSKAQRPREVSEIDADIASFERQIVNSQNARDGAVALIEAEKKDNRERAAAATAKLLAIEGLLKDQINAKCATAVKALDQKIAEESARHSSFVEEVTAKIAVLEVEKRVRHIDAEFPRIDMSFLKQTRPAQKGEIALPKFGLFTLDSAVCQISAVSHFHRNQDDSLIVHPKVFGEIHDFKYLQQSAQWIVVRNRAKSFELKLTAVFTGAIPPEVKELLSSSSKLFDRIYIVNEPEWQIQQKLVPFPPVPDPLVIGMKDGVHWLIASFDTTPSEEYIRREFTEGKLTDVRADSQS
jgi:hypothetical protein